MLISLIFIVLLRFLAGVMVWVMIVLVILVIGYGTSSASDAYRKGFLLLLLLLWFLHEEAKERLTNSPIGIFHCYMEFASLKNQPGSDVTIRDLGLQTDFAVYLQIRQTWLAFSTRPHTFYPFIPAITSVGVTCARPICFALSQ